MIASILLGLIILFILFGPQIIVWLLINIFKFNEYMINEYRIAKRVNRLIKRRKRK